MKKALMVASVASMIEQFNMNNIAILKNIGFEVHVAANFDFGSTFPRNRVSEFQGELCEKGIKITHIDFDRNIFHIRNNIHAYRQIKKLIEENQYDIIHCHSPIGGVLTRLAAKNAKYFQGKAIYTAHGFHFYKGAPLKNWLIYYPIERWFARYTDVLITINQEDFVSAKRFSIRKGGKVTYVPGVGVDIEKIRNVKVDKNNKRYELGIELNQIVLLSVGELNGNKNHEVVIRAIARLKKDDISYLICGQGVLDSYLKNLAKILNVEKQIKFLGYRSDAIEIMKISDIFIFPSKREGLGMAALEAIVSECALISSNVHGIVDYSKNGKNSIALSPHDIDGFKNAIDHLLKNDNRRKLIRNSLDIVDKFDINKIIEKMDAIYRNI